MSIYLGTQRLATNIAGDTSTSLPLAGGALTGDLTFSNVGDGIVFQAGTVLVGATRTSNTFDDYEEGTWIPTTTNSVLITEVEDAIYTKIGNKVIISAHFTASAIGSVNVTSYLLNGIPFTPAIYSNLGSREYSLGVVGFGNTDEILYVSTSSNDEISLAHENNLTTGESEDVHFTLIYTTND